MRMHPARMHRHCIRPPVLTPLRTLRRNLARHTAVQQCPSKPLGGRGPVKGFMRPAGGPIGTSQENGTTGAASTVGVEEQKDSRCGAFTIHMAFPGLPVCCELRLFAKYPNSYVSTFSCLYAMNGLMFWY